MKRNEKKVQKMLDAEGSLLPRACVIFSLFRPFVFLDYVEWLVFTSTAGDDGWGVSK